ncbi:MAG: rhomboid family intramembrane serine protease [Deltaproteobacteria bacterium]|nr:rhomboid family intramembrane serine protease [Deltaproteobacteria bacterium]
MTEKRNSILCPGCRKLISRDEAFCPYCNLKRPAGRLPDIFARWSATPGEIVQPLIILNVAFYILSLVLAPVQFGNLHNPLNFLSPGNQSLFGLGATGALPIFRLHRWWTLISASFLHGSLLHLLFNMVALNQLGRISAEIFGLHRFLIIYLISGAIGFLLSSLAGIMLTIGASASLCGLIGALLFYGKSRGGEFGRLVIEQVRGWIIGLILIGLFLPTINNWGHGGGLLGGLALAALLGYQERRQAGPIVKQTAVFIVIFSLAILGWAVVQAGSSLFH